MIEKFSRPALLAVLFVGGCAMAPIRPPVVAEYDKFKDVTTITITKDYRTPDASKSVFGFSRPHLWVIANYPGTSPKVIPPSALFGFRAYTSSWKYLRCHSLDLLADEKRIAVPNTEHEGSVITGDLLIEYVMGSIPFATLKQIAESKVVEVKLCNDTWALTPDELDALREMVQAATPK